VLSDIVGFLLSLILNINTHRPMIYYMKHTLIPLCTAVSLLLASPAAAADCFADYKAKQDNPLRLHYGVAQINGPCSNASAKFELTSRLAAQGWTLLSILSTFAANGLGERKQSAGPYYLRF
jgi:hypothetical protein